MAVWNQKIGTSQTQHKFDTSIDDLHKNYFSYLSKKIYVLEYSKELSQIYLEKLLKDI